MAYNAKTVIVDLGFIDGYVRNGPWPQDDTLFDYLLDVLERIEEYSTNGVLLAGKPDVKTHARFLHDLAFVRGYLWPRPIPYAVSEAIRRVIDFGTDEAEFGGDMVQCNAHAEANGDTLSDHQRGEIEDAAVDGRDSESAAFAASIGASHRGVLDYWRNLGVMSGEDVEGKLKAAKDGNESPKSGGKLSEEKNEVACAELPAAAEQEVPAPAVTSTPAPQTLEETTYALEDGHADEIRRLSETMSDDEIADRLGVSRSTIIRTRKKHGIEKPKGPRDGKTRWAYQWEPWQKENLIEMKLAGASYGEIAKALGKTNSQCSGMWFWEKKKLGTIADQEQPAQSDSRPAEDLQMDAVNGEAGLAEPEAGTPSVAEPEPANPLADGDWPDIAEMLGEGRSLIAISGDFEVPVGHLERFIARHRDEGPPLGKPCASSQALGVGAN